MQSGLLEFTSYIIPVGKLALRIMSLPLLWVVVSPFAMSKPPNNTPTLMQQGLSNSIAPIKFQKEEKTKEAKTEVSIIRNVRIKLKISNYKHI